MPSEPADRPRRTARTAEDLVRAGTLPAERAAAVDRVAERYALALPPALHDLVDPDDPDDPIARQFVPSEAELRPAPDELLDPIADDDFTPLPGITHRYPDRLLLKPVHVCPVYCRFCFRREKVGPGSEVLTPEQLDEALDYVARHREVWEVILTGGDPLVLSPRRLGRIARALDALEHVRVVRIHTRVPVAGPERVTAELVEALKTGTATWVVLHTNHPRELTGDALAACARLVDGGLPMLSQSVLLRGVNDDTATLERLFRVLVANRIKPYYLHHPDLARGTSHLRVTLETGQRLVRRLRGRVSGVCQPTYVLDLPGGHGKVPVGPSYLEELREEGAGTGRYRVEDPWGARHEYPPRPGSPERTGRS